jgi:hypothetical protein
VARSSARIIAPVVLSGGYWNATTWRAHWARILCQRSRDCTGGAGFRPPPVPRPALGVSLGHALDNVVRHDVQGDVVAGL